MKRIAFLMILSVLGLRVSAQTHWTGSGTNTFTSGNVGIGTTATPTATRLQINNHVSMASHIPEIQINRTNGTLLFGTGAPNFFEVWNTPSFPIGSPRTLIDVISANGYLGILTPTPAMPLDVKGNAIVRGNTTVTNNLFVKGGLIDMSMPTDGNWRTIQAGAVTGAMRLCANTLSNNGPNIEMYGKTYPTVAGESRAGWINYCAYSKTAGHRFLSYDGTAYHTNATISNTGQMIVGSDTYLSDIVNGDVLTVKNKIGFLASAHEGIIDGNAPAGTLSIQENSSSDNGPSIGLLGKDYPALPSGEERKGQIRYNSYGHGGYGHLFFNYNDAVPEWNVSMAIQNNGKVVIGQDLIWAPSMSTATPDGYLLYVQTGILTEKLKVANKGDGANWSDFVFNKDYDLMPLNKVESYVKTNRHLPEIPSASDVAKDGIDVANMDAKLLQKIEELTLYVIQQQKEIDELKQQIKH